jgi:hypothetical protein
MVGILVSRAGLMGQGVGQRCLFERWPHSCQRTVMPPVLWAVSGNGFLHVHTMKACSEQKEMWSSLRKMIYIFACMAHVSSFCI